VTSNLTSSGAAAQPPHWTAAVGTPVSAADLNTFIVAWGQWLADISGAVEAADNRAANTAHPDRYTGDVTLTQTLLQTLVERTAELDRCYDGGRTDPIVIDQCVTLISGRGNSSRLALVEAATLLCAQLDRLVSQLNADIWADPNIGQRWADTLAVADQIRDTAGRSSVTECVTLAGQASALVADFTHDINTGTVTAADIAQRVASISATVVSTWQQITEHLAAANTVRGLHQRYRELLQQLDDRYVTVDAEMRRCHEKLTRPPSPTIPARPAPVPIDDSVTDDSTWKERLPLWETAVDELGNVVSELDAIIRWCRAAMNERDDLRGLLAASAARGAARGPLTVNQERAYAAAHAALYIAPCDVAAARELVNTFRDTLAT
jgi:PAS domain-containing protein